VSKAAKRERQRLNREAARAAEVAAAKRARATRSLRNFVIVAAVFAIAVFALSYFNGSSKKSSSIKRTYSAAPKMTIDPSKAYTATMDTSEGKMVIALDPKTAPQTVNSFVFLAKNRFYDGLAFHRIVTDFVDQGGDPKGNGTGGPGYTLPDEPPKNGYQAGSVAMASSGPNTTGSQFFLTVSENGAKTLDGTGPPYKYSILGQIVTGLDVAQKINSFGGSDQSGTPTKKVLIKKVTIQESPAGGTSSTSAPGK
jgi:cyclophilin family peptidyl-prolyl cis-trans isomerase